LLPLLLLLLLPLHVRYPLRQLQPLHLLNLLVLGL
jgi:hypothetical protein